MRPTLLSLLNSTQQATDQVLPNPKPAPWRCRNAVPPNFTLRRSSRIAKTDYGLDSELKAKRVLLRRLGILEDDGRVDDAILAKYAQLFTRPLTEDVSRPSLTTTADRSLGASRSSSIVRRSSRS